MDQTFDSSMILIFIIFTIVFIFITLSFNLPVMNLNSKRSIDNSI
jgi:hypothetical protein